MIIDDIWDELIFVAKQKKVITYSILCNRLQQSGYKINARFLAPHLTTVAHMCVDREIPILAALVVRGKELIPGDGYFRFQREYRGYHEGDYKIWRQELSAIWNYWSER